MKRLDTIQDQALFRIAMALHQYQQLDALLDFIAGEVRDLIGVEGASVILLDEEAGEFFFRVTAFDDPDTGKRMKEVRYPVTRGVAGYVYRTGQPLVVQDTYSSPYFFKAVDDQAEFHTRSMLDVPIRARDRMIGVMCAVNKKRGTFGHDDVEMVSAIAGMVALPIENARINEALAASVEALKRLNAVKDRVIHRVSHELKTPISVLLAAFRLLGETADPAPDPRIRRVCERAQRNLDRLLQLQYDIEDLLSGRENGNGMP